MPRETPSCSAPRPEACRQDVLDDCAPERRIYLPMCPNNRSLNLSNAVAVVVFEAWRQSGFAGAARGDVARQ